MKLRLQEMNIEKDKIAWTVFLDLLVIPRELGQQG